MRRVGPVRIPPSEQRIPNLICRLLLREGGKTLPLHRRMSSAGGSQTVAAMTASPYKATSESHGVRGWEMNFPTSTGLAGWRCQLREGLPLEPASSMASRGVWGNGKRHLRSGG